MTLKEQVGKEESLKDGDIVICTDPKNCYGEEPHKIVKLVNRHTAQVLYPNGCYTYEFISLLKKHV